MSTLRPTLLRLANAGYVAAAADYRLTNSTHNRFPAALEDVGCAIDWLVRHRIGYGIDAQHIVVIGESAGSQLASLVAVAPTQASRSCSGAARVRIVGVVAFYGVHDFLLPMADQPRLLEAATRYLGVPPDADTLLATIASPARKALRHAPPFLLLHGTADDGVSIEQSRRMRDALLAAGNVATLIEVEGQRHGFAMLSEAPELRASSCATMWHLRQWTRFE